MIRNHFEDEIKFNRDAIIFWKCMIGVSIGLILKFIFYPAKEHNLLFLILSICLLPLSFYVIRRNNRRIVKYKNIICIDDNANFLINLSKNWVEQVNIFHNKIKTDEQYCREIKDKLAAIFPSDTGLIKLWEADPYDKTKIVGFWAEDNSPYEITVPYQLRDMIIKMQHQLPHLFNQQKKKA